MYVNYIHERIYAFMLIYIPDFIRTYICACMDIYAFMCISSIHICVYL
jgi:hypothetical protein